jgi:hypothetical protein
VTADNQRFLGAQDNAPGFTDADAVPEAQVDPVSKPDEMALASGRIYDPHGTVSEFEPIV